MLMAVIQMVLRSQQSVTAQVACIIKKEFATRVGHATLQVQHQAEEMLTLLESRVINKLDSLLQKEWSSYITIENILISGLTSTMEGGRLYHW